MRLALVGATGLVGQVMRDLLESRKFPVTEFIPVASERSVGQTLRFNGKECSVISVEDAVNAAPDMAIFSAGGTTSTEWAPKFAEKGCFVIDNSSAWRMSEGVPLVVPEINANELRAERKIIANPNCSTIQLVMVLKALQSLAPIERVIVSTYQSVTGTGKAAVDQMEAERRGEVLTAEHMAYPYPIDQNALPHCDVFMDNGYTKEEMKLTHETVKILSDPHVLVSATAVRVPVQGGHSESVNITFSDAKPSLDAIRETLAAFPGIEVVDNPGALQYPMPRDAHGRDEVFVGRIRDDHSHPQAINLWIVSDNLRKGAATNAVQIAEALVQKDLLPH